MAEVLRKINWQATVDEQRLWAPWRLGYVAGQEEAPAPPTPTRWRPGADQACFMCRAAADYADEATAGRQNLVVHAGEQALALLNRYPYSNGHLLVTPLRHVGQLTELSAAEHLEMMHILTSLTARLSQRLAAEGFNVGLNLGSAAGAGVPGHLHWHLVPRWAGDHNFMPTVAGTRVMPQALAALWEGLLE